MKCSKCNNENGKYNTSLGVLCEECYEKTLCKVEKGEEIKCSKCGRSIHEEDFYALTEGGKTTCVRCFNDSESHEKLNLNSPTQESNSVSHGMSTFMNIIGICVIIVGFIIGFVSINTSGFLTVICIICGIISGSIFLGLGKTVFAAEIYIWKNKQ
jgi:DNA-directed RNA polymerase subunit RPC12/RpoP